MIIAGLSLFLVLKSGFLGRPGGGEKPVEPAGERVRLHKVLAYVVLALLYGVLLESAGFLITSSLLLFLILKFVERQGWRATILVGGLSIAVGYALFVYFLQVPLPRGFLLRW